MGFNEIIKNGETYNKSTSELAWRLIHNGVKIIFLEKMEGVTTTKYSAYMSTNFKEIVDYIIKEKLNYYSLTIDDYDSFYEEAMIDLKSPKDNEIIRVIESFHPENWTLVYNDNTVVALQQEAIKVNVDDNVFTSNNIIECFNKINELDLEFPQQEEFELQYDEYFGVEPDSNEEELSNGYAS